MKKYYLHLVDGCVAIPERHRGKLWLPRYGVRQVKLAKHACTSLRQLRRERAEYLASHPLDQTKDESFSYLLVYA